MVTPKRDVRISDELWERAKSAAKQESCTVSALIVAALESYIEMVEDMAEQPERKPPKRRAMPNPVATAATACAHPKSKWENKGWGTVCGLCQTRMR